MNEKRKYYRSVDAHIPIPQEEIRRFARKVNSDSDSFRRRMIVACVYSDFEYIDEHGNVLVRNLCSGVKIYFDPDRFYTAYHSERGRENPYKPQLPTGVSDEVAGKKCDYYDAMKNYVRIKSLHYLSVTSSEEDFKNGTIVLDCHLKKEKYDESHVLQGLSYIIDEFLPRISKEVQGYPKHHSYR